MFEMKRTREDTFHSSIPPCRVGSRPKVYGLYLAAKDLSLPTNAYRMSIGSSHLSQMGEEMGLVPLKRALTLCDIFAFHTYCPSTTKSLTHPLDTDFFSHLNTTLVHKQTSEHQRNKQAVS